MKAHPHETIRKIWKALAAIDGWALEEAHLPDCDMMAAYIRRDSRAERIAISGLEMLQSKGRAELASLASYRFYEAIQKLESDPSPISVRVVNKLVRSDEEMSA